MNFVGRRKTIFMAIFMIFLISYPPLCSADDDGVPFVSWIAGNGTKVGGDGPAIDSKLSSPTFVKMDFRGDRFLIADRNNQRIEMVLPNGNITTVVGNGTLGFFGDGGQAKDAWVRPTCTAFDLEGNMYIADQQNHRVRRVGLDGIITTIAGTGTIGYSGDGGDALLAQMNQPSALVVDFDGNLIVSDYMNNAVRKIFLNNRTIISYAGNGTAGFSGNGGPASSAMMRSPYGLWLDEISGDLFVVEYGNGCVRKISANGIISQFIGVGRIGNSPDGTPSSQLMLNYPFAIVIDRQGNSYVTEFSSHKVRKILANGTLTTLIGTVNNAYGTTGVGGPAILAQIRSPVGISVDLYGNLLLADFGNNRALKINVSTPQCTTAYWSTIQPPLSISVPDPANSLIKATGQFCPKISYQCRLTSLGKFILISPGIRRKNNELICGKWDVIRGSKIDGIGYLSVRETQSGNGVAYHGDMPVSKINVKFASSVSFWTLERK